MQGCVTEWLCLYASGFNYRQIGCIAKVSHMTVFRHIRAYIKSLGRPQLTRGKLKKVFATADAGLILAYHQCGRCASPSIKLIYDEGVCEGARCGRCGNEMSLMPGAASLRR